VEESLLFLDKARESLASAQADLTARRFNSCANRAYYAAFQAAIAALIDSGIEPRGDTWSHAFVLAQFSGTLIRRRKSVPSSLRGLLDTLQDARNVADYEARNVSRDTARKSLRQSRAIVRAVSEKLEGK
jgi:uncharacterized protein (UPF0332 family)